MIMRGKICNGGKFEFIISLVHTEALSKRLSLQIARWWLHFLLERLPAFFFFLSPRETGVEFAKNEIHQAVKLP